ncbi:LCP family protein [Oceanobacillus caeni]|nr:LCP family protein [Oceanobacillus caeni]
MRSKKRNKRKSRIFKIAVALLAMIVVAVGYFVYQYNEGVSMADPMEVQKQDYEFNGQKNLDKVNVLLLGVDARPDEGKSRTDSIMVAQYDPKEGTAKLISIMRDIYSEIPGYKNYH